MQISPSSDRFIQSRMHSPSMFPAPTTNYQQFIGRNLFGQGSHHGYNYNYNSNSISNYNYLLQDNHSSVNNFSNTTPLFGSPVKILDIPGFRDDFYVNTVEWSDDGPMAIALGNEAYVYTPDNLFEVCRAPFSSYVSGLKFGNNNSSLLTVGLSTGVVEVYDLTKPTLVRSLSHHQGRVCALGYLGGGLLTGGKDGKIYQCDLRIRQSVIAQWEAHKGEVVTIKPRDGSGSNTFVSGGNDGMAAVWDSRRGLVKRLKGHSGAVKAISWCSWKAGLLATGGGCNDKTIKLWNIYDESESNSGSGSSNHPTTIPLHSQVTSLQFNRHTHSLLSSHGYSSGELNQWSIGQSSIKLIANVSAHRGRVLSLGENSDGTMIYTAGSDQMLKIWQLGRIEKKSVDQDVFSMRKIR